MEYFILSLGWLFFYISHTFLASLNIKRKVKAWMGMGYKWYRFCYSLFATMVFFALLLLAGSIEPIWLLASSPLTTYLGFMLATFGTIIAVKSMKHSKTSRFLGLEPHDDLKEKEPLITVGWYQYMRHPLYTGLILIFLGYWFYLPNLASLIHLLALLLYLPFGIYFEEKKLQEQYGEAYTHYKNKVPPLIPRFKK
ncbi:methyltransferase family protein [Cyclobacterium plantarum]|uniref:Isoprenylcysteine carboxylmethyltransferase family protein n=1 Tax=Cyclobacterium plantarum TaxID=2716263 RepID=A0ABX0HGI4_9BACT|nr:isoprenylcysteine carboxylmethyltransferase family protein [Cyclobacterium plantarum]NHE59418.1 isoprenylcysteine carboxylmethyltransferase family protein [Cyclobacterium plantarum]